MRSLLVLFTVISCICAQERPHRLPKDLPPGFATILPPGIVLRLRKVHEDTQMTPEQQLEAIDKIMLDVPESLIKKLPKPPGFENLPQETRDELDRIHHDRTLDFRTRHEKIKKVFDALPQHLRPRPPPPPRR